MVELSIGAQGHVRFVQAVRMAMASVAKPVKRSISCLPTVEALRLLLLKLYTATKGRECGRVHMAKEEALTDLKLREMLT